jgi:hypothetical protein
MQMQQQRSKQAMQRELNAMKLRMVDVLPSPSATLALLSDAAADDESTLSVNKMRQKFPVLDSFPIPKVNKIMILRIMVSMDMVDAHILL